MATELAVYYEGGTVDRFWLAPEGLGIAKAKAWRVGRLYKTRAGATRALDKRRQDDLRRDAFETWEQGGALGELDLRAAAHYAQEIGDGAAERTINGELAALEAMRR